MNNIYAQGFFRMWTYLFEKLYSILLENKLQRAKLDFMWNKRNPVTDFLPRLIVSKNVNALSSKRDIFVNYILMTLCCLSFNGIRTCCYYKYNVIASSLSAQLSRVCYLNQFDISKSSAWIFSIRCDISYICFLKSMYWFYCA